MSLFIEVLNMSYLGSIVILFVLAARLLLKKAPKKYTCILWLVALLRLAIPFSFESVLSFLPSNSRPIPANIAITTTPQMTTGNSPGAVSVNDVEPLVQATATVNPLQIVTEIAFIVWLAGMAVLLIYGIVSLLKMKELLKGAKLEKDNIYVSEKIRTPFVLGIFRPKIYLPTDLDEKEKAYIVLHEQTHIKRFDPLIRFISFIIVCLHWFNPLVWAAFYFSGKDMEMACDEAVIRKLGEAIKKDYSQSLLDLATGKHQFRISPLAFGQGDIKGRIKNILNFKKPKLYIIILAVVLLLIVMVGLLTDPLDNSPWLTEKEVVDTFEDHDLA